MTNFPYRVRVGTVLSQAVNALIFNGHPDMSLSARAWVEDSRFWRVVRIMANAIFGEMHCYEAFMADVQFAQEVLALKQDLENDERADQTASAGAE